MTGTKSEAVQMPSKHCLKLGNISKWQWGDPRALVILNNCSWDLAESKEKLEDIIERNQGGRVEEVIDFVS